MITWKKEKENILKRLLLLTKQTCCFFQSYACKYLNYLLTNKEYIYMVRPWTLSTHPKSSYIEISQKQIKCREHSKFMKQQMNYINEYINKVSLLTSQVSSAASSSLVVQSNQQNAKTSFVFLVYLLEIKNKINLKICRQ